MKRIGICMLTTMMVLAMACTTAFAYGGGEASGMYATAWALVPPLVAIALALVTKEVYSSLLVGCLLGGLLYTDFNVVTAVTTTLDMLVESVAGNIDLVAFLVMLGIVVVLMNRSGGSRAYGKWAISHIKTRRGATLATVGLALGLGVDDYFNNLTTGNVMRPVTDSHGISRAKLAYIIDATAAPVCIMMPISSWAAAVSGIADSMEGVSGLQLFISAIPWNFYAILTLFSLVLLTIMDVDFGPMRVHEQNARKGDLFTTNERPFGEDETDEGPNGKVMDLLLPVFVLITSCVTSLLYTGGFFDRSSDYYMDVLGAFADCSAPTGLMYGAFVTLVFAFVFYMIRRTITFAQFTDCIAEGFKVMVPAILILSFAWTISGVTNDLLGAKYYVEALMTSSASSMQVILPAVIFVVSAALAFATGTSWGTFGILIPIVVGVFGVDGGTILTISMSACLGGAVCGDHCSPISDTTILASTGAQCFHLNHVRTQLPYAVVVAVVSCVSYMIAGFVQNVYLSLAIALALMTVTLLMIGKKYGKVGN